MICFEVLEKWFKALCFQECIKWSQRYLTVECYTKDQHQAAIILRKTIQ